MHKIVLKKQLSHDMFWIEFEAPFVAKKAKPGQFIIFRVDEYGERVPQWEEAPCCCPSWK